MKLIIAIAAITCVASAAHAQRWTREQVIQHAQQAQHWTEAQWREFYRAERCAYRNTNRGPDRIFGTNAFVQRLGELGWIEGRTVAIESQAGVSSQGESGHKAAFAAAQINQSQRDQSRHRPAFTAAARRPSRRGPSRIHILSRGHLPTMSEWKPEFECLLA